jgi:formylglycine-generating enzyme required for sulfatase activity
MVLIPGGTNSGTDPDFGPYSLTVNSFYMDVTEVTKAHWSEVRQWAVTNRYSFDKLGYGKTANHPVQRITWYDMVKWCNARSQKEGLPAVYTVNGAVYRTGQKDNVLQTSAAGYRLPTDLEWQYAARGGVSNRRYSWGDMIDHSRANYCGAPLKYTYDAGYEGYNQRYAIGNKPYTSPVGSFAPNGYGLYDMEGNVSEWCFDWRSGYEGNSRVLNGGCWYTDASLCRIDSHSMMAPINENFGDGFRTVRSPDQP